MDARYEDLQLRYVAEMRAVMPDVLAWWAARAQSAAGDIRASDSANAFELRWPAGPVAHPRILEVFRRYFLEADALNLETEVEAEDREHDDIPDDQLWGEDAEADELAFQRPIDLLVNDLQVEAPDLHEVLQGLVFVPIGLNPDEEFC